MPISAHRCIFNQSRFLFFDYFKKLSAGNSRSFVNISIIQLKTMTIKFGKILQDLRRDANVSQQDIANVINCSRGTYSCWERDDGEIPLSKLLMLLNYYNISFFTFFKRVKEENHNLLAVVPDTGREVTVDIKEELNFISSRIALLNQHILL